MPAGRVLCVVGPTAVGKSAVAEEVACALNSEIVSVDSMQVYAGMDIGTAKTPADERRCPLLMVDVAQVDEDYSVSVFQRDARTSVDGLLLQGKVPVLCGGTGLYLDAVIDEMSFPPGKTGGAGRLVYEQFVNEHGVTALHELLASRDAASAATIHPNNVRRVIRALEMLDEGTSYAQHHEGLRKRAPHYEACIWALILPREVLYRRIDERVDKMFADGLVDEVVRLKSCGIQRSATASKAIGYKETLRYLEGELTLDETRDLVKRNTRRYAKRQLSWLRRDARASYVHMDKLDVNAAARVILDGWEDVTRHE